MELMTDDKFSPCSLAILSVILEPLQLNVPSLCAWCWSQQGEMAVHQPSWTAVIPPSPPPYPADLPQQQLLAIENDGASRARTNSGIVGEFSTATKKSKRRPSLLGNNPLLIRSPLAKRRRHHGHHSFSLDTASPTFSQSTSSFGSCFVEDLVRTFLVQGLSAAQNISDNIGSDEMGPLQNLSEIMENARMLSGCTRFLFCMLQFSHCCPQATLNNHGNEDEDVHSLSFLVKLAENWRTLSRAVHNRASVAAANPDTVEHSWTPAWEALAEVAINCGLCYVQNASRRYILQSKTTEAILQEGWSNFCSALGLVFRNSLRIEATRPKNKQMVSKCNGSCREFLESLALDVWNNESFGSELCLCELLPTIDRCCPTNTDSTRVSLSDLSIIILFSALPLPAR